MTHLFGVPMQDEKKLRAALMQISGIGCRKSTHICKQLGFSPYVLWGNLTPKQKEFLHTWLVKSLQGGDSVLKSSSLGTQFWHDQKKRKNFLIKLGTRRGIRLRQGLPVRGQRTHSNARTAARRSLVKV